MAPYRLPQTTPCRPKQKWGVISTDKGVRRLPYPESKLSTEDKAVLAGAIRLLGGPNNGGTKLWWDKKN